MHKDLAIKVCTVQIVQELKPHDNPMTGRGHTVNVTIDLLRIIFENQIISRNYVEIMHQVIKMCVLVYEMYVQRIFIIETHFQKHLCTKKARNFREFLQKNLQILQIC